MENGEAKLVHYFIIIIIYILYGPELIISQGGDYPTPSCLRAVSFQGSIDYIPRSFTTFSYVFFCMLGLFCQKSSNLHVRATKPMLHLTWPSHNLTSSYWMSSFVRRESEVALSFALILQITSIVSLQAVHCVCCHC